MYDIKEALELNDCIVEFEITSNRCDCLSVIGLAREAAVTFGKPFSVKDPTPKGCGGDVNELAEQLQVTITYPDNPERAQQIKMLSELTGTGNSLVIDEGHMTPGQDKMAFTVRVTFVTDENNNDAVNQEVEFDLTVSAVQTEKTVTPGANN